MKSEGNCAPEGVFGKTQLQKLRDGELCRGVCCRSVVCVGGTEHRGPVCVRTSRVRPTSKCERIGLSGVCGLGVGPEGAVPFDFCVRDKGCVVDVGHAPDCNC